MKGCAYSKCLTCFIAFDEAGTAIPEGLQGFQVQDLCSHVSHSISSQHFGHRSSNATSVKCTYSRVYVFAGAVCVCVFLFGCDRVEVKR
jgi:hypothetical protein